MSGWVPVPAAGGVASAPNVSYERIGYNSGAGTTITASATANAVNSTWTLIGTTTSEWNNINLHVSTASGSHRHLIELATNSSGSVLLLSGGVWVQAALNTTWEGNLPVNVPAGTTIYARTRSPNASAVATLGIRGRVRGALDFAGFSTGEALGIDGPNGRPGAISIAIGTPGSWVQLGGTPGSTAAAVTTRAYGALAVFPVGSGTFATAQNMQYLVGTGASGSEIEIDSGEVKAGTASSAAITNFYKLSQKAIPSGTRLSMRVDAAATGDSCYSALIGFY